MEDLPQCVRCQGILNNSWASQLNKSMPRNPVYVERLCLVGDSLGSIFKLQKYTVYVKKHVIAACVAEIVYYFWHLLVFFPPFLSEIIYYMC